MINIRTSVFETNSSSVHSLSISVDKPQIFSSVARHIRNNVLTLDYADADYLTLRQLYGTYEKFKYLIANYITEFSYYHDEMCLSDKEVTTWLNENKEVQELCTLLKNGTKLNFNKLKIKHADSGILNHQAFDNVKDIINQGSINLYEFLHDDYIGVDIDHD